MINLIVGISGMIFILIAFSMNQFHKWRADDVIYDIFNLAGSSMLLYYAVSINSIPFALLNLVWALVSIKEMIDDAMRHGEKKSLHIFYRRK